MGGSLLAAGPSSFSGDVLINRPLLSRLWAGLVGVPLRLRRKLCEPRVHRGTPSAQVVRIPHKMTRLLDTIRREITAVFEEGSDPALAPTVLELSGAEVSEEGLRAALGDAIDFGVDDERDRYRGRQLAVNALLGLASHDFPGKSARREAAGEQLIHVHTAKSVHRTTMLRSQEEPLLHEVARGVLATAAARGSDRSMSIIDGWETARLLEHAQRCRPQLIRLLEFSSDSVKPALTRILRCGWAKEVRLLVGNPQDMSPFHQGRLKEAMWAIFDAADGAPSRVELSVRCYSQPPALRGYACDDKFVALGWYTHEQRQPSNQEADSEEAKPAKWKEVWGHDNALIVTTPTDARAPFDRLYTQFDRVFTAFWAGVDGRPADAQSTPLWVAAEDCQPAFMGPDRIRRLKRHAFGPDSSESR